jgi:ATP-dependent Clp protease protease subunit
MIYDIMKMLKSPIATYCIGSAMYESLLILAAGSKGLRHATKSSTICLSQLAVGGDHRYSNMVDAEILLEQAKRNNKSFIAALSENIDKPVKKVFKDSERERFLTAAEAKKYGLIDNIIGSNKNDK